MDYLDGSGVYRHDAILGKEMDTKHTTKTRAPQIEEVRAIIGEDGETYINAKDALLAMKKTAYLTFPTLSVFNFIRCFMITLITTSYVQGGDNE